MSATTAPALTATAPAPATCDGCGPVAVAVTTYRLTSGRELALCGHHARQHGPALLASGASEFPA